MRLPQSQPCRNSRDALIGAPGRAGGAAEGCEGVVEFRDGATEFCGGLGLQMLFDEGAVREFVCLRGRFQHLAEQQTFGGVSADVEVSDLAQIAIGGAGDADASSVS